MPPAFFVFFSVLKHVSAYVRVESFSYFYNRKVNGRAEQTLNPKH